MLSVVTEFVTSRERPSRVEPDGRHKCLVPAARGLSCTAIKIFDFACLPGEWVIFNKSPANPLKLARRLLIFVSGGAI
jgi:hypothetical protein